MRTAIEIHVYLFKKVFGTSKSQKTNEHKKNCIHRREAMVQWLRQMAHDQEVVGSNPGTIYQMDVRDNASYYIKRKYENKGSQVGQTKKIFKKKKKKLQYGCNRLFKKEKEERQQNGEQHKNKIEKPLEKV